LVCFIKTSSGDTVATLLSDSAVWVSVIWGAPVEKALAGDGWGGHGGEEQEQGHGERGIGAHC
jgi:hypothetical protein